MRCRTDGENEKGISPFNSMQTRLISLQALYKEERDFAFVQNASNEAMGIFYIRVTKIVE